MSNLTQFIAQRLPQRLHLSVLLAFALVFSLCTASLASAQEAGSGPGTGIRKNNANPQVIFTTDLGDITIELYPKQAPQTVDNFLHYCRDGFYLGTIFHRVVPGFVIQGGGHTFDYVKKDTREPIKNESSNGLKNTYGRVSMARYSDPDSATSQFFINLADNPNLDATDKKAGYTVFGQVISGMDVAEIIALEPSGKYRPEAPNTPVRILNIAIQ